MPVRAACPESIVHSLCPPPLFFFLLKRCLFIVLSEECLDAEVFTWNCACKMLSMAFQLFWCAEAKAFCGFEQRFSFGGEVPSMLRRPLLFLSLFRASFFFLFSLQLNSLDLRALLCITVFLCFVVINYFSLLILVVWKFFCRRLGVPCSRGIWLGRLLLVSGIQVGLGM